MNFSDFITDQGKRVNKEHYMHLIQVSKADGRIEQSELEMLHKEGKKFGLTDPEIDKLIASESSNHYNAPYSLEEKFEHLHSVAEMILADDIITEGETRVLRKFAIEAGFEDKAVDILLEILFEGIRKSESEEVLLSKFRTSLFSR
jgi:uncharacterized tellurite resistance protein B-like protein